MAVPGGKGEVMLGCFWVVLERFVFGRGRGGAAMLGLEVGASGGLWGWDR